MVARGEVRKAFAYTCTPASRDPAAFPQRMLRMPSTATWISPPFGYRCDQSKDVLLGRPHPDLETSAVVPDLNEISIPLRALERWNFSVRTESCAASNRRQREDICSSSSSSIRPPNSTKVLRSWFRQYTYRAGLMGRLTKQRKHLMGDLFFETLVSVTPPVFTSASKQRDTILTAHDYGVQRVKTTPGLQKSG